MRLYEYEGKELFQEEGIEVPGGGISYNIEEASAIASKIGYPVVVKAQVLQGGRGKAGLIKVVENENELSREAEVILSKIDSKESLLIEKMTHATTEGYVGITIDDLIGKPVVIMTRQGGIYVEEASASGEGNVAKCHVDIKRGFLYQDGLQLAKEAGFTGKIMTSIALIAVKLYRLFTKYDATTVEINPLLIDDEKETVVAGDSKFIVDDYALYRQPKIEKLKKQRNIPSRGFDYIELGGNIGIVSIGASNTMMVCDSISVMGGEPANFMDTAGGQGAQVYYDMCKYVLEEARDKKNMKVVLLNLTLTASPLDPAVNGFSKAIEEISPSIPIVACIRASGASTLNMSLQEGKEVLRNSGVTVIDKLEDTILYVVDLAKNGGEK